MLKKGLTLVTGLVRERLGKPSGLRQFLDDNAGKLHVDPLDAEPGNAADSMPRWHEWGQPSHSDGAAFKSGEIMGWKTHRNFGYRSYRVVLPELAGFGSCLRVPGWRREVQEPGALHVRPLRRQRSSEHYVRHLWDGPVLLIDDDAARDFAAVPHVAAQSGQRAVPGAELLVFSIEPQAVNGLRRDFELFAISSRDVFASVAFHDAVRRSRTPYLSKRLPQPRCDTEVIFLPRIDRRSMALAAEMRTAGFPDVGKHLSTLVLRQHMNAARRMNGLEARAA
jgi:hypothetical protein